MNITFHGAAHQVTGSNHLIEFNSGKSILLDCGMFQGGSEAQQKNAEPFPYDASTIDAVIISHAHADHSGRVPKLVKDGFAGNIYMTEATRDIAKIIWDDSVHIMEYEHRKFGKPIVFTQDDAEKALSQCVGVQYHEEVEVAEGVTIALKDAGHIFGSSFVEVSGDGKRLAYSGDVGNKNQPILKPTEPLASYDVLLIESTYGNRIHEAEKDRRQILLDAIKDGCERGGTIMMPAFSIERTQEILYDLDQLKEHDKTLPDIHVYVDSPMAIRAIEVFKKYPENYNKEACSQYMHGDDFLDFQMLTLTPSRDDSKKINSAEDPKLIIAGSGMMTGGRILHHAKRYLQHDNTTLIIVGYQAQGTLGRKLYEGAEHVKIHDVEIPVRAKVVAIGALSAHADQDKLVQWVSDAEAKPGKVYCIHGEPEAATALAHRLRDDVGVEAYVPEEGESIDI